MGIRRRWIGLIVFAFLLKLSVVFLTPLVANSDFLTWVSYQGSVYVGLSNGNFNPEALNVYTGISLALSPFYGLWTLLPIKHPELVEMIGAHSVEATSLIVIMKAPILLFDLVAGILIFRLVRLINGSVQQAELAFLVWYLNPYNAYWTVFFGGYDLIPTVLLIAAVMFGIQKRWVLTGVLLSFAGILRLFPFLLIPFFLLYSFKDNIRSSLKLLASFLAPAVVAFLALGYAAGSYSALWATLVSEPGPSLLKYYGVSVTSDLFKLAPFLFIVQLYLVRRFWSNTEYSLLHVTTASLLVLFTAAIGYGGATVGTAYHLIWLSPFLSAYFSVSHGARWLFILLFVTASLYPVLPETLYRPPVLPLFEPLFAGWLYGCKAAYLVQLNLEGAEVPQAIGSKFPALSNLS